VGAGAAGSEGVLGLGALGTAGLFLGVMALGVLGLLAAGYVATRLSEGEPNVACANCPSEIPCFNVPEKGTKEEMDRQLKEQQDAINNMTPDEILENLKRFEPGGSGRPNDSKERQAARDQAYSKKRSEIFDELMKKNPTMDPYEADIEASKQATEFMKGKDATHVLDWIAGGDGEISGVGGSSENRSIGSQWKHDVRKRDALKKAAEAAKAAGKDKMNVKLSTCE
jgi:hypothetical protein